MRRIVLAVMGTVAAVVVLFGYRTSTAHPVVTATVAAAGSGGTDTAAGAAAASTPAAPSTTGAAGSGRSSGVTSSATPTSAPATTTTTPTTTKATTTTKVTGTTAQTQWGPVQLQLTVTGGKITAVTALQLPSGNGRDVEINDQAVPILVQETLAAQSARIDSVSGATYTSEGYLTSLQSALDQAGL